MKQRFTILSSFALLSCAMMWAGEFNVDGIYYNTLDGNNVEVVANPSGYSGNVVIPAQVINEGTTYNVIAIGKEAFLYSGVSNVEIPEGVKSIGDGAFVGSYLEKIKLPDSLETLGVSAFQGCFSATELSIGHGVKVIPDGCFYTCMFLESIEIPDQVETIGNAAFQGCGFSATKLTFGSGLKSIGHWAFYNFRNITSLVFPEGLVSIGECAFEQCDNLTEVRIPASVETIGYGAISGRGMQKYIVAEGNSNYVSFNDALYSKDLSLLINYPEAKPGDPIWPEGLKVIGQNACARAQFVHLVIPEGVETIENAAFYASSKIESLKLPSTLNYIGETAFYSNESLRNIDWSGSSPAEIGKMAFAYCWINLREVSIPEGLVDAPEGMFYGCDNLVEVTFPSTLLTAGSVMFNYCPKLETVHFKEGVTTLGDDMFYECVSLRDLKVPDSVTSIGTGLCFNCNALETLDLGSGLKAIPDYAFSGCTGLKTVISRSKFPPRGARFPYEIFDTAELQVPEGSIRRYQESADDWSQFLHIVPIKDTGVESAYSDTVKCYVKGGEIILEGAEGMPVRVCDFTGKMIYTGNSAIIPAPGQPVIVKVGNNTFKVK